MLFLRFIQYTLLFILFPIEDTVVHHKPIIIHQPKVITQGKTTVHSLVPREANSLQPCNEDDLMVYLAEMQAINPESIVNLCTQDDFAETCRQISASLDKVDQFLETCTVINDKDLYIQLMRGIDKFYDYLCNTTSHREAFQKYIYCFQSLREEYESCAGPADWTEYKDRSQVCNAYKEIVDCYYIKTAKICGLRAARIIKDLMTNVINVIITTSCDVKSNPYVSDPMPEPDSGTTFKIQLSLLLVIPIVRLYNNIR